MVERIMLFKLHEPETRAEVAALSEAALDAIDAIDALSVGLPADAASLRSWDLSIVFAVENLALLDTVLASPAFVAYLEQTMSGRYAVLKAWSFERRA